MQQADRWKIEREARLWHKVRHPRPPGKPRKQWEAEVRAAFRELGVHGPIQRLTPERGNGDRVGLTAKQRKRRWQCEAQAAREALDKSSRFWRCQVQDREKKR
jgi:hypothetical protein